LAQRVHDVLAALVFIKNDDQQAEGVSVVALDGTAPIAAVAASQIDGLGVKKLAIDTRAFRFIKVSDYLDANFLPGGSKYGDVPGFLSLAAGTPMWLAGESAESAALVQKAQAAAGKPDGVTFHGNKPEAKAAAMAWLLK
jgi:hypothetical protein